MNIQFNDWLAGIIDGSGSFCFKKKSPSCLIHINTRDDYVLRLIRNKVGGTIKLKVRSNSVQFSLSETTGLLSLVYLINGRLHCSDRLNEFKKLCFLLNIRFIYPKVLTLRNAWFAGFFNVSNRIVIDFNSKFPSVKVYIKKKKALDPTFFLMNGYSTSYCYLYGSFYFFFFRKRNILTLLKYLEKFSFDLSTIFLANIIKEFYFLRRLNSHKKKNISLNSFWRFLELKWSLIYKRKF